MWKSFENFQDYMKINPNPRPNPIFFFSKGLGKDEGHAPGNTVKTRTQVSWFQVQLDALSVLFPLPL